MKKWPELVSWFHSQKRAFPWREEVTPYRVWVSEVMLQQTRASVVIEYFTRWMQLFPTVADLAGAPLEKVLKAWEGLGYYSRARNLHKGAQRIVREFGGKIPSQPEALASIEGIGPYTQGAILSFAFHKRAAAVDGNVLRVLSRFWGIEEPIDLPAVQKEIRARVQEMLPEREPWVVSEALIELGALVCGKKPACAICPLRKDCEARKRGLQELLPKKRKKMQITRLHRLVAVVESGGAFLVRQVELGKVMGGLWEFPYLEMGVPVVQPSDLREDLEKSLGLDLEYLRSYSELSHTFTRFKAQLFPAHWVCAKREVADHVWMERAEMERLPFSSGHRRILQQLLQQGHEVPL